MKTFEEIEKQVKEMDLCSEQFEYVICKAWYETLKSVEEEIEKKVLQKNEFYIKENKGAVRNGRYLMNKGDRVIDVYELDEEQFNEYLKLYYDECNKEGIKWEWGRCISADARECLAAAENVLIDWFIAQAKKFGQTRILNLSDEKIEYAKRNCKYREWLINLAMKWHSNFENYAV